MGISARGFQAMGLDENGNPPKEQRRDGDNGRPHPRATTPDDSPFARANAVDPAEVLDWLGVERDGTKIARCPGCDAGSGVAIVRGGWSCRHASCAGKGHPEKPGFRTNVDSTMELKGVGKVEAVKLLAGRFGFQGFTEAGPVPGTGTTGGEDQPVFELVSLGTLLAPAIERADKRRRGEEKPVPVAHEERGRTLGGGYWPGLHFCIAGTGAGKSQLVIEDSIAAAKSGIPVLYIALELDGFQVALRFLAEQARLPWSKLYRGTASEKQIQAAGAAVERVSDLPIYCDFAGPAGWPMSRLTAAVKAMRKAHPTGPIMIVLDYLQLIAAEPDERRRVELRERIGQIASLGHALAVDHDAAIVVVSSTARGNYGALGGDAVKAAGITMVKSRDGSFAMRKVVLNPDVLVGAGKESGEIEASADSVTVLVKWPSLLDTGERIVLAVTAKGRCTGASWSALVFEGGQRFVPFAVADMDDLPALPARGAAKEPVDIHARVLTVVAAGRFKSRNQIVDAAGTGRTITLATIRELVSTGQLTQDGDKWYRVVPAGEGGTSETL